MNSKFEKFVEILSQYRCTHMHLQSECEKCVLCIKKFCQNIFVNSERFVKFVKLKTHEILCYTVFHFELSLCSTSLAKN